MLIQTFESGYKVIRYVFANDTCEIYICREVSEDAEYTVVRVKDRSVIPDLVIYLTSKINKGIFTDYKENFIFENDFYFVLKYHKGIPLSEKLEGEFCSLSERMKLGLKMMEKIVLLDMPSYFQSNCLTEDQVLVKPGMEIAFNYVPKDIRSFSMVGGKEVLTAAADLFKRLFEDELSKRSVPPINRFYGELREGLDFDSLELFKKYTRMCREVESLPTDEIQKPKNKLFVIWDRSKKVIPFLKKLLATALLILAVVYLIYTIDNTVHPKTKEQKYFSFIGTVEIHNNGS